MTSPRGGIGVGSGRWILLWAAVFSLVGVSGCATLRKKFIRQKKKEDTVEVQPVLVPKEYPAPQKTAEGTYRRHYALWRAWLQDLQKALEEGGSDKRMRYILDQMRTQLAAMTDLLVSPEDRTISADLMRRIGALEEALDRPPALRRPATLQRMLQRMERQASRRLRFAVVRDRLKP